MKAFVLVLTAFASFGAFATTNLLCTPTKEASQILNVGWTYPPPGNMMTQVGWTYPPPAFQNTDIPQPFLIAYECVKDDADVAPTAEMIAEELKTLPRHLKGCTTAANGHVACLRAGDAGEPDRILILDDETEI